MPRSYHIDIAVVAADANRKWVDNLLSHFDVPGVECARQGIARRLSQDGIYHIVLVRQLVLEVGFPVGVALGLAKRLLTEPAGRTTIAPLIHLVFERQAFQEHVDQRVLAAVESVVPRSRGRPTSGRSDL